MVFGVILDWGIRGSVWALQSTYNGIHYLYYGHQETNEEKILRELQELKKDNESLKEQLTKATVRRYSKKQSRSARANRRKISA